MSKMCVNHLCGVFDLRKPKEPRDKVQHHKWFSESIPLIASENVRSLAVREANRFGLRQPFDECDDRLESDIPYIRIR